MKVRVSTIPSTGMKINAPIPLEPLNDRLKEGQRGEDITFTNQPNADLTLTKAYGGAEVRGVVSAQCEQLCATCGDSVDHKVTADVGWVLQSLTEDAAAPGDLIEDPGVLTYSGDHIDLEDPLQEALILNLTPFWHPERSADGKCTLCSRDCSKGVWGAEPEKKKGTVALGDLLSGALKGKKERG